MTQDLSRNDVAERLGVAPITIYRWEKKGISPVKPRRLVRNNRLIYSEADVTKFREWMNSTKEAVIGRAHEDSAG